MCKSLKKGCVGYFAYIVDAGKEGLKLDDILVVLDFLDVFPEILIPTVPPEREIEFEIKLIPGGEPISKTSY